MAARRVPPGLGPRARRLWRAVCTEYEPSEAQAALLLEACRVADRVERINEELAGAPLMAAGSRGQDIVNPLLAECRQQELVLAKLLRDLGLHDADDDDDGNPWDGLSAQDRARKAATARWSNRGGRHR